MSNFATAAMNALNSANEADNPRDAAAHRREADVYAKLDIADAIRTTAPNTLPDVPRCPHSHKQAEPGQVDGGKAATPTEGSQPTGRELAFMARAEKAEAERDDILTGMRYIRDRYAGDPRIKHCATHFDLGTLIDEHAPEAEQ